MKKPTQPSLRLSGGDKGKKPLAADTRRTARLRRIIRASELMQSVLPQLQADLREESSPKTEILRVLGNTIFEQLLAIEADATRELQLHHLSLKRPYNWKQGKPIRIRPAAQQNNPLPTFEEAA